LNVITSQTQDSPAPFHEIPRDPVNLHGDRIVSIRPASGDRVRLRAISDRTSSRSPNLQVMLLLLLGIVVAGTMVWSLLPRRDNFKAPGLLLQRAAPATVGSFDDNSAKSFAMCKSSHPFNSMIIYHVAKYQDQ